MKKKLQVALLALMLSGFMAGAVLAEDVYVTKNGKKYHSTESRFAKTKESQKLTREEAEAQGYTPSKEFLRWEQSQKEESQ